MPFCATCGDYIKTALADCQRDIRGVLEFEKDKAVDFRSVNELTELSQDFLSKALVYRASIPS